MKKIEKKIKKHNLVYDEIDIYDIEEINNFGKKILGGNHLPDSNTILERQKKSPNIIKTLSRLTNGKKELVGYYILYPLTEEITSRILNSELMNAKEIEIKDIKKDYKTATSLYIGMLVADSLMTKAIITKLIYNSIQTYYDNSSTLKYIFAKAASEDGNRITKKRNFIKMENTEISYSEIPLLDFIIPKKTT